MIGWIQLSRSAVASAEQALKTDSQGVRDEVGFLALHQAFADLFFPGTSVLHTRLRYVFFVPWLMERACGDPDLLRKYELELTKQLKDCPKGNVGIIGATVWPNEPSQTPSMAYWSALNRWGILHPRADDISASRQQTLNRIEAMHQQPKGRRHEIDGEPLPDNVHSPFVQLPAAPPEFLKSDESMDFRLSKYERAFMRRQLLGLRRSPHPDSEQSLLARLVEVRLPVAELKVPWAESILDVAEEEDQRALLLAKKMSALAGIGRAVYAALVEQLKANGSADYSVLHREHLKEMVALHGKEALALDINQLSALIKLSPELLDVLNATQQWLASKTSAFTDLQHAYLTAERERKGARSRLATNLAGRKRRDEWDSDEHPLAEPLHYRWSNVRRLLTDLLT